MTVRYLAIKMKNIDMQGYCNEENFQTEKEEPAQ